MLVRESHGGPQPTIRGSSLCPRVAHLPPSPRQADLTLKEEIRPEFR